MQWVSFFITVCFLVGVNGQLFAGENPNKELYKNILENNLYLIDKLQDKDFLKIILAMIYYCEGVKNTRSSLIFINSDPQLIRSFLKLLRRAFIVDESKFRVCLHLHSYHNQDKQISFWSKITHIPKGQFIKPYIKNHTGIRKREGYQGCASIRYHDTNLSRQLLMMAKAFMGA